MTDLSKIQFSIDLKLRQVIDIHLVIQILKLSSVSTVFCEFWESEIDWYQGKDK